MDFIRELVIGILLFNGFYNKIYFIIEQEANFDNLSYNIQFYDEKLKNLENIVDKVNNLINEI